MDVRFLQIFVEGDVLYGLADDGSVWMCQVRTSTDNGVGLKLGELLDGWRKLESPKEEKPKSEPRIRTL